MTQTTVPQPIKWAGGKGYMSKEIIKLMPEHLHYVEPYFGSGALLLEKDPEGISEVVNDLNYRLTNFWLVLQDEATFERFKRIVEAIPFSEVEWNRHAAIDADVDEPETTPNVDRAVSFFVACRQSRSGSFKSFATVTRNRVRRQMNEQVSAWLSAVEGLPAVHARLQRVLILNGDAIDVIRQQDGPKTLFYLDPPYVLGTRSVKDHYTIEMSDDEHGALR